MDNSGDALMIEPHKTAPGWGARCNSVPLEYRELGYPSIAGAVRSVWQLPPPVQAEMCSICQPIVGFGYRQFFSGRVYFLLKMVGE